MSAFDDEFGLFGDETPAERRSTLGARKIASNETIIDDIEPEEDGPRRGTRVPRRQSAPRRDPADPVASRRRARDLLEFLAKKLAAKPEAIVVESYPAENGEQPLIELIVDPEDIGKVIGRSGRVAQALRTIVRATAEGRISVEIYDSEEIEEEEDDDGETEAESGDGSE